MLKNRYLERFFNCVILTLATSSAVFHSVLFCYYCFGSIRKSHYISGSSWEQRNKIILHTRHTLSIWELQCLYSYYRTLFDRYIFYNILIHTCSKMKLLAYISLLFSYLNISLNASFMNHLSIVLCSKLNIL